MELQSSNRCAREFTGRAFLQDVEPQAEVQTMQRDSDGHGEAADLWEGPHSECEVEDKESEEIADIAEASRSVTWNGTRDEAAEAANVQLLEAYRKRVKQLEAGQRVSATDVHKTSVQWFSVSFLSAISNSTHAQ